MTSIDSVCDAVLDVAVKIVNPELGPAAVSELVSKAGASMIALRSLNRQQLLSLDAQTKIVESHKEKIDTAQLRLENLLYRQNHLKREITACKEIDTPHLHLVESDLSSVIALTQYTDDLAEQHSASLQRLNDENNKRRAQQALLAERQATLTELTSQLAKKQKLLDDLPSKLTSIIAATADLEKYFNTSWASHSRNLEASSSLSAPLYTLYHLLHTHVSGNSAYSLTTTPELTLSLTTLPLAITFHSPSHIHLTTSLNLFPKQEILYKLFPEADAEEGQYVWVQVLCGEQVVPSTYVNLMSMKTVLQRISARVSSLMQLQQQISSLSSLTPPSLSAPAFNTPLPPLLATAYAKLAAHASRTTVSHLKSLSVMNKYAKDDAHCVYLKATILLVPLAIAATGKLSGDGIETKTAIIELSPEYPLVPPRFMLQEKEFDNNLHWLQNELNTNCLSVIDDASPVNIEETLNNILHYQLLLLCLYAPIMQSGDDVLRSGRNRRGDLVKIFYGRSLV